MGAWCGRTVPNVSVCTKRRSPDFMAYAKMEPVGLATKASSLLDVMAMPKGSPTTGTKLVIASDRAGPSATAIEHPGAAGDAVALAVAAPEGANATLMTKLHRAPATMPRRIIHIGSRRTNAFAGAWGGPRRSRDAGTFAKLRDTLDAFGRSKPGGGYERRRAEVPGR